MPFPLTFVDGKVGVGVSNPDAELDVNGDVDISGTLTVAGAAVYGAIVVTSITTSTGVVTSTVANSGTNTAHTLNTAVALSGTTNLLKVSNNGAAKMTLTDDGEVTFASYGTFGNNIYTPGDMYSSGFHAYTAANPVTLGGLVPNGASAVAATINNIPELSTAGAKLLSIQNNSVEKANVDKDGNSHAPGYGSVTLAPTAQGMYLGDGNNTYVRANTGGLLNLGAGGADYISVGGGAGTVSLGVVATTKIVVASTDSSGTPGAATINKASGRSTLASGTGSAGIEIANNTITASSKVFISPQGIDTTAPLFTAVCGASKFTVTTYSNAGVATNLGANWTFDWFVISSI